MARKKTNEEFIKEVYELVGEEYIFLEEYTNSQTKIKCKHSIGECGYEWGVTPNSFLNGNRCPSCANKLKGDHNKKTNKQFVDELKVGEEE